MAGLQLDHFVQAGDDFEGAQYRVLSGLQEVRQAFSRNIIYPHLGELIKLHDALHTLIHQFDVLRDALPGTAREIDLETRRIVYDKPAPGPDEILFVEELIRWAMPHVRQAIEEGRMVFEFVEENLYLEEVGILPSYVEEGYLMLPDPQQHQLHILRYTLSVFTRADERFRSLKTSYVKSMAQGGVYPSPQSIKLDLIAEKRDLPNPATYFFATDLDFPFEQTMLPVAKRKLLHYLATQGGRA